MVRLGRYRIGIPRELSEIRTQPWLSEGSLTCDPCSVPIKSVPMICTECKLISCVALLLSIVL